MTDIPVTTREQIMALKIVTMLREECKDDLLCAVKSLALANQMFQRTFAATVNRFTRLQKNKDGDGGKK